MHQRRDEAPQAADGGGFEAEVDVVEPVGSETFVNVRFGPHPMVARLPPEAEIAAGQRLRMAPAASHLHWFDAASGERLEPAA